MKSSPRTPRRILIVSEADDPHAIAVAWALRRKGHVCEMLFTPDFPTCLGLSMGIGADGSGHTLMRGPGIDDVDQSAPFDTIWLRRPGGAELPEDMHPGDRVVASRQCEAFLAAAVAFLDQGAGTFWVNPLWTDATSRRKPTQLRAARKAGLTIPETLFSNDPVEIREFLRKHGGTVAHKLLEPASWLAEDEEGAHVFAAYTVPVSEEQLPDDETLRLCPGIFQPFVDKAFEIRVSAMGDFLVAARIDSQSDTRAATDWRVGQLHVDMDPYELPDEIARGCRRLMRDLGLAAGALDFIVTPGGEHVFLEVNPQGQFLFLETRAGLPLLDMWSEFLAVGTLDFRWRDDHPVVRFSEFIPFWKETWAAEAGRHARSRNPLGAPDGADAGDLQPRRTA